jgi:hypothetical protein
MTHAAVALRITARISGVLLIVLGALFWSGHALDLIPMHMLGGLVLVASLWGLAALAIVSGAQRPLGVVALVWGAGVIWLGMAQDHLLLGSTHWVIQVLHLLLGLGAIGQAERLSRSLGSSSACCDGAEPSALQNAAR